MFKGIDFYSDTVTRPTAEMRRAIITAEVGDEQKGEDPTTLRLEEKVAELLGHSAAMFFPSATMANEVAIRLLCERGDELIAAQNSHLFIAEGGGPAIHSGVMVKPIRTRDGLFSASDVREAFHWAVGPHYPRSRLLSLENTTNMGGGVAWPIQQIKEVIATAKELGLSCHMDGARLMNAAVALKISPKEIAHDFDTVTLCLSKGLGCPAGALLTFDREHYTKVRRIKQWMGGALRQSGILAAAGLYALENHVDRLIEDHKNAKALAVGLSQFAPSLVVENTEPSTNMVYFQWRGEHLSIEQFISQCIEWGVRVSQVGPSRLRAVTHLDIRPEDIEKALKIFQTVCKSGVQVS